MHRKFLFLLTLPFLFLESAFPAEFTFHFSGSLEGARNCDPSSAAFCGPFRGIIRIDDGQVGRETAPFARDYTADVVITFADNQTASCRPHPAPLAEELDPYRWTRTRFCLISVERHGEESRTIQLSIDPLEQEVLSIALRYTYKTGEFDIANLAQVLEYLQHPPSYAVFSVVGGACSWGPCVDRSVSQLTVPIDLGDIE